MGGLVARALVITLSCTASPGAAGCASSSSWARLTTAPRSERVGNWTEDLLKVTRFTAPYRRLGMSRSAGITDLRYGSLHDEDWDGLDRFERRPDPRRAAPLPEGVACLRWLPAGPSHSESRRIAGWAMASFRWKAPWASRLLGWAGVCTTAPMGGKWPEPPGPAWPAGGVREDPRVYERAWSMNENGIGEANLPAGFPNSV